MVIPAALSKEVGAGPLKLPLWGWAIAGVGGIYVARKITGAKAAATAATDTSATDTSTDTTASLPGGGSVLTVGDNGAVNVPGGALSPATAQITDNDAWRTAAISALVSGGYDALLASDAVEKYLDGDPLTVQEQGAIAYALTRVGPTPLPVAPSIAKPPATSTTVPAPKPIVGTGPTTIGQQSTPNAAQPALSAGHEPGEAFVGFANNPLGKGTWWLTNWGGVYAVGGAPFKGAPINQRVAKKLGGAPDGQTFVSIAPFGTGYRILDNRTDTGDYTYQ